MGIVTISSLEDIERAVVQLEIPEFHAIHKTCSPVPLLRKPPGFASLLQAIVGQQVSLASAAAILERIQAAGLSCETALAQVSEAQLAGLACLTPKFAMQRRWL